MTQSCFTCIFRINQKKRFSIWYRGTVLDGFILDDANHIILFQSRDELQQFARSKHLMLEETVFRCDIDYASGWTETLKHKFNCEKILQVWNYADDFRCCVENRNVYEDPDERTPLYEKLFFGTNPPVFEREDMYFVPVWTTSELQDLKRIICSKVELLKKYVKQYNGC
jgi:hypothetical protein